MRRATSIGLLIVLVAGAYFFFERKEQQVEQQVVADAESVGVIASAVAESIQLQDEAAVARVQAVLDSLRATGGPGAEWSEVIGQLERDHRTIINNQGVIAHRMNRILCTMNPRDPACPHQRAAILSDTLEVVGTLQQRAIDMP